MSNLADVKFQFYRLLADDISMPIPSCYYADVNASEKKVVILLEDVSPSVATDWKMGCTLNQAQEAITELATFHARWWGRPGLEDMGWPWRRDMATWRKDSHRDGMRLMKKARAYFLHTSLPSEKNWQTEILKSSLVDGQLHRTR